MYYGSTMNRTTALWILIVIAVIGLADATYLSMNALNSTPLVCDIQGLDDCNAVAESPYSRVIGIPLAVYGLGFYALAIVLIGYLFARPSRLAAKLLLLVTALGVLASIYFLYLQVYVIEAVCIYCLGSALASFLLCGLSIAVWKRLVPQPPAVIP